MFGDFISMIPYVWATLICGACLRFKNFCSKFAGLMKRIALISAVFLTALNIMAQTPASSLVEKYKEEEGARNFVARGVFMRVARAMMKDYAIAPLSHKVEEVSVLRMDKADAKVQVLFLDDLRKVVATYMYGGKSDGKRGIVDTYVHLASDDVADELVVYNPDQMAIYSLKGKFTIEELRSIQQPVE